MKLDHWKFLKELTEANGVSVPIKNSRIAADVYDEICAEVLKGEARLAEVAASNIKRKE